VRLLIALQHLHQQLLDDVLKGVQGRSREDEEDTQEGQERTGVRGVI
jgi:hypothetical protein